MSRPTPRVLYSIRSCGGLLVPHVSPLADPGFRWGGGAKWKTRICWGSGGGGGLCKPPSGVWENFENQAFFLSRNGHFWLLSINTSLAEVKRCFTNHVGLYRSLLCGWRSTRWRCRWSTRWSSSKSGRSVRQGFQCWTRRVVHLRQAQPSSSAPGRASTAQGAFVWAQVRSFWESDTGLSRCLNLDESPNRNFALLGQSQARHR